MSQRIEINKYNSNIVLNVKELDKVLQSIAGEGLKYQIVNNTIEIQVDNDTIKLEGGKVTIGDLSKILNPYSLRYNVDGLLEAYATVTEGWTPEYNSIHKEHLNSDVVDNITIEKDSNGLQIKEHSLDENHLTSDYNQRINTIEQNLEDETEARTLADNTLQNNINNESLARTTGDNNLSNRLSNIENRLTTNGDIITSDGVQTITNKVYINPSFKNYQESEFVLPQNYIREPDELLAVNIEQSIYNKIIDGSYNTIVNIDNSAISDNAITTNKIQDNAVTTDKINNGAVTENKLDNNSVTTNKLDNNAVSTSKIQDNAVTTSKIADMNVTLSKLPILDNAKVIMGTGGVNQQVAFSGDITVANNGEATINAGRITSNKLADDINIKKLTVQPSADGDGIFNVCMANGTVLLKINTSTKRVIAQNGMKFEGDGSLLTNILSVGTGGTSSTTDLQLIANSDSSGGGDIKLMVGNTVVGRIKGDATATKGIFEIVETAVATAFLTPTSGSVGIGAKENQLYRIDDAGKTGQILCANDWSEPKGGYLFNGGTTQYALVKNSSHINFGVGDFSIELLFYITSLNVATYTQILYEKISSSSPYKGIQIYIPSLTSVVRFRDRDTLLYTEASIAANTLYHVVCERISGVMKIYINGVLQPITVNSTTDFNNSADLYIGGAGGGAIFGKLFLARLFNRALSQAEVKSLYNNGLTGQNALPFADVGASNTNIIPSASSTFDTDGTAYWDNTAGRGTVTWDNVGFSLKYIANGTSGNNYILRTSLLNRAKKYNLKFILKSPTVTNVPSINFGSGITAVLAPNCSTDYQQYEYIISNTLFSDLSITFGSGLANLTECYIDNIVLTQIGCVAEYLPENAGTLGWIETQNALHGQTSGSPILLNNSKDITDVKTLVTGNTTLTSVIPKRYLLKRIIVENTTANAYTLNVGSSTSGGTDVVNGASISANTLTTITINKIFSMTTAQTLYLQSANWNSSSSSFYLDMELI